jgi:hypothetical protein
VAAEHEPDVAVEGDDAMSDESDADARPPGPPAVPPAGGGSPGIEDDDTPLSFFVALPKAKAKAAAKPEPKAKAKAKAKAKGAPYVAPADLDDDDGGAPRQSRKENWGPFQLAKVVREGICIGYGATCKRHSNFFAEPTICKRQLGFGGVHAELLSDHECQQKLKLWLLNGSGIIPPRDGDARNRHRLLDVRSLDVLPEEELVRQRMLLFGS